MHKIKLRRLELDLSISDVAVLSGVAPGTIGSIERGGRVFKINFETARTLAYGLDTPLHTLFCETELSDLGRPALTGTKIGKPKTARMGVICISCHLEIPRAHNTCPTCIAA
ncbi:MAG TPA: helix-turn-helix transcriptional regulator [Candidatus Chromulinivoraceae bacterium]|nr:helix-turn-helix transcriptional regulator [Candidatus Chromulinivoraceae bacterium]